MVMFRCPGCKTGHQVRVDPAFGSVWGYNGNPDAPTFTPSILVRGHKYTYGPDGEWDGWAKDADGKPIPSVCHSFVTDGRIQFLGDCTHALAGQTVPLPEMP
jgi:hypothetical protein